MSEVFRGDAVTDILSITGYAFMFSFLGLVTSAGVTTNFDQKHPGMHLAIVVILFACTVLLGLVSSIVWIAEDVFGVVV